ncbi:MAG: gamma-glutamyltransferase, partial [Gemmatimonas sp.]
MLIPFLALLLQAPVVQPDTATLRGVRSPSYAPDGRMVLSIEGDLYLQLKRGREPLLRLTEGAAWDRDPIFSRDGHTVIFASDRGGNYDLWEMGVNSIGETSTPLRLTATPEHETSPTEGVGGAIAFVRGSGNAARIWIQDRAGKKKARVDSREVAQMSPAFSPTDESRIAYISLGETGRRVVVRTVTTTGAVGNESIANSDRNAEHIAWAPGGDRLALSSRSGVFIVPMDGRWTNFASLHHGDLAWSPDGQALAIAEYDEVIVGYNGDPDRGLDRSATERVSDREKLYLVAAPQPPDVDLTTPTLIARRDRAARNADTFDRTWERSAALYFSDSSAAVRARRATWETVKRDLRPRALAATSDSALQRVVHTMLQRRPNLRTPAVGRAAVSSAHPVATEAGLEVLRRGGNVVDAAVAVSFALGVVEPDASGIGVYGEMVIALKSRAPTLIEFMSRVPEEAGLSNTSLLQNGRYPADGPVLANVPGTVAGMYAAFKKYGSGKVTWSDALAPAVRAARNGYAVSEGLATTLTTEREHFAKYEGSRALF